jgi:hypothetical protein
MNLLKKINVRVPELEVTLTALHETLYQDGNYCVLLDCLYDDGQMEQLPISVNIPDEAYQLEDGEFFMKNWSELTPIADALQASGLLDHAGYSIKTGYVRAPVVSLK